MRTESKEFPIITLKALQTEGKHPSLFHSNFLVGGEVERPLGLFLSFRTPRRDSNIALPGEAIQGPLLALSTACWEGNSL